MEASSPGTWRYGTKSADPEADSTSKGASVSTMAPGKGGMRLDMGSLCTSLEKIGVGGPNGVARSQARDSEARTGVEERGGIAKDVTLLASASARASSMSTGGANDYGAEGEDIAPVAVGAGGTEVTERQRKSTGSTSGGGAVGVGHRVFLQISGLDLPRKPPQDLDDSVYAKLATGYCQRTVNQWRELRVSNHEDELGCTASDVDRTEDLPMKTASMFIVVRPARALDASPASAKGIELSTWLEDQLDALFSDSVPSDESGSLRARAMPRTWATMRVLHRLSSGVPMHSTSSAKPIQRLLVAFRGMAGNEVQQDSKRYTAADQARLNSYLVKKLAHLACTHQNPIGNLRPVLLTASDLDMALQMRSISCSTFEHANNGDFTLKDLLQDVWTKQLGTVDKKVRKYSLAMKRYECSIAQH